MDRDEDALRAGIEYGITRATTELDLLD